MACKQSIAVIIGGNAPSLRRRFREHAGASSSWLGRSIQVARSAVPALILMVAIDASAEGYTFETIALCRSWNTCDELVPELGGDTTPLVVQAPALNEAGEAAFALRTTTFIDFIFRDASGALSLINGETVCGGFVDVSALNERADAAYTVSCDGPVGTFLEFVPAGSVVSQVLAGRGGGEEFANGAALNNRSQVATLVTRFQEENDEVLLFEDGLAVTIAAEGDRAPRTGRRFGHPDQTAFTPPFLNDAGDVTFHGWYGKVRDGNFTNVRGGIFATDGGRLRAIALDGHRVPRTSERFVDFGWPRINNAGDIAFLATFGTAEGIFTTSGGVLHSAVVSGDPVPGTIHTFEHFSNPVLNRAGDVSFIGEFADSSGIFATRSGLVVTVALVGQPAPGTRQTFAGFGSPAFNRHGQVAFLAELSGGGIGLFVGHTRSGELVRIVSSGDLIEVAAGDVRQVTVVTNAFGRLQSPNFIGSSGNEDGVASGLNDQGQVGFSVLFEPRSDSSSLVDFDGGGVFIATPEPDRDQCPDSDQSATIVIDGNDTGVENVLTDTGCTIQDLIVQASDDAADRTEFIRGVALLTRSLLRDGLITAEEASILRTAASQALFPLS
jgi:hypothetical protein